VGRTNFSADFLTDCNFAKIVAPCSDKNKKYLAHLKGNLLGKTVKTA